MKNRLKQLLDAGKPAIGAQLRFGSPAIAELMGHGGFDWLVLDTEHAPQTPAGIQAQLQAIDNTPATGIVRIPKVDQEQILLYLDMGAMGILCAFVNTGEQAQRGARACRYPPAGNRGWGPHRATRYGQQAMQYSEEINDKVMFIPIIESAEAVKNIDAIIGIEGVDAFMVGPADLTISLGIPFQFGHQKYLDALKKVAEAAKRAGKPAGAGVTGEPFEADTIPMYLDMGFTAILMGGDESFLTTNCRMVGDIRKKLNI